MSGHRATAAHHAHADADADADANAEADADADAALRAQQVRAHLSSMGPG